VTDTRVPAFPNVLIIVTEAAVLIDGEVVDRGSAGDPDASAAIDLGVHAASRRVAQRLGRPVRATLRSEGEEKRIIVYPDGSATDAEKPKPVPGAQPAPIRRPARRPIRAVFLVDRARLGMVTAYVALGAVLAGGLLVAALGDDDPTEVATGDTDLLGQPPVEEPPVLTPRVVKDGTRLDRLPGISQVAANPDTGGFQLRVTTNRSVRVRVLASPASGDGGARLWTLRLSGATTRTLDIDDLTAGSYRWVVRSPGEQPMTGNVMVPATPDPPAVTEDDASPSPDDDPTPSNDDDGDGDGDDSPNAGPTGPIDPDDPTTP